MVTPPTPRLPSVPPPQSFTKRFAAPIGMIVAAVVITLGDGAYAAASGEVLRVGPLRPIWIAAALVLAGIGMLVARFIPDE
jgi:hypothetical protein